MKCWVIKKFGNEIENLVIEERAEPAATGENIRVKVLATALNRADLLQRRGLYNAPSGVVPDIPGLEFVGVIDSLGEQVTEWKGGERVFGVVAGGSYAEKLITHQRTVVPVPDNLSDIEAAAIPEAFITAHDALVTQGNFKSGDLVLIYSVAGGVGSAAVQLVNLLGGKAIGIAGSGDKLLKIAETALFHAINYREEDIFKNIEKKFGKQSVDIVIDTVGGNYWQQNLKILKNCGFIVIVGLLGGANAETNLSLILTKRLHITGTVLRARPLEEKIIVTRKFAHEVVPHFTDGKLKSVIDSVFQFEKLHEATLRMENNENTGKIILKLQ
ncbi:MAG: NAD(P)H-quinone oxidoreductase [Candidatus Schekmanbacteria bacterium]|nr:NAD(P)H-quinone oxidoreductase [Candidatus Schekmanbacteria bacterium]